MTPLPSSPLIEGLLAMVRADVPETCGIHNGKAPPGADLPYAVFYFDTGSKAVFHRNVVNDAPRDQRYQTTFVGETPEQVAWVADAVTTSLTGGVPVVAGRRVWPVIDEGSQPIDRDDESTGLFFGTSQWLSRSDPA